MPPLHVVILAAGVGKRMRSDRPKVLHRLAHRSLLEFVVEAACALEPERVHVVYGHGGREVPDALAHLDVAWVQQAEQLGTGHAVEQAMPGIPEQAVVLVLYGDVPLIASRTLAETVAGVDASSIALITVHLENPSGYGRIVRDAGGSVVAIVEERDAGERERAIREINTGILAVPAGALGRWLGELECDNAQGEYYLTDVIALAVRDGFSVRAVSPAAVEEVLGVNDRAQLAHLERCYQRGRAEALMREGVTLRDPARFDVRGEVSAGRDVVIDVGVLLEGRVTIGDAVSIGPHTIIRDTRIGDGVEILGHSVIEGADIGAGARIGPFSRIRPETRLGEGVHVGNFVEIKKSEVGAGSKVNHLSYVGDTEVGRDVNVGAGTITCNYDGANKHRTVIGDQAFIGSGTELVAPVKVGAGATIGAGSTITRDAPPGALTLARSRQATVEGWKRPVKKGR